MLVNGVPLSYLWEWSLGYRMTCTSSEFGGPQDSQFSYAQEVMVETNKS